MSTFRRHDALRGLAVWGVLLAALASCREEALPPELPPRAIQWMSVSGALAGEQRVISGIVTAISDTRLAFDVGGTVQSVEVSLGHAVDEGRVLARLDPEPFELAVRTAEAALAEARALQAAAQADSEREAGLAPYDAIVRACLARLRPIVMTALTTILGMMPIIISRDPLFYDMAVTIAFGLAFATVLTLGMAPVLYATVLRIPSPLRS